MFWRDNYAMDFLAGDYVIYAKNVPILISIFWEYTSTTNFIFFFD